MKRQIQNNPLPAKTAGLLLFSLFATPTTLHSQEQPTSSQNEVLLEMEQSPPLFWRNMRYKAPLSRLSEWEEAHDQITSLYVTLGYLLNYTLFKDHFFEKFASSTNALAGARGAIQANNILSNFSDTLREQLKFERIMDFMEEQKFQKADKLLTFLILIHNYNIGAGIFDWIEGAGLSVNDTLAFKDIKGQLINRLVPEELRRSDKVVAVLSHHLASTGNYEIIKRLFETNYDPGKKTYIGENILHSFARLNTKNNQGNDNYKRAVQLLVQNSTELISEKDIWNSTPLAASLKMGDRVMLDVLQSTKVVGHLSAEQLVEFLVDNGDMFNYLKKNPAPQHEWQTVYPKIPLSQMSHVDGQELSLSYLDFEPMLTNLFQTAVSMIKKEPETPEKHMLLANLSTSYPANIQALRSSEATRLRTLAYFLRPIKSEDQGEQQILKAITERNADFFKPLRPEQINAIKSMIFITQNQPKQGPLFATDFLLEAIRNSHIIAVEAGIEDYYAKNTAAKNLTSLSPDPLSLSLLTYASLPMEHPLKQTAKEIIKIVAKNTDNIDEIYDFPMKLTPLSWAMLLGLIEEVKFLHEEKGAEILNTIILGENVEMPATYYTMSQGWMMLSQYLNKHQMESSGESKEASSCKQTFVH